MSSIIALLASTLLAMGGPVTGVSIAPLAERTQVVIAVDGEVEFREFTMEGPNRLVVDLFGARHALPRDNFLDINRGGVVSVRTSQYSADIVRVVLELTDHVPYEVTPEEGRLRITLQNPVGVFAPWTSAASDDGAVPVAESADARTPEVLPTADLPRAAARKPMAELTSLRPRGQNGQVRRVQSQAEPISVTFTDTPLRQVLLHFAEFSGQSIVPGQNVTANITATIEDQPWDEALRTVLLVNGFKATQMENGIIRVDNVQDLSDLEAIEPTQTRAYKINYATAEELTAALQGLTTERGSAQTAASANTVIVTDIPRVHEEIEGLIEQLDIRTPQVSIQAKIIFVNRTDLNELGVTYELKDSEGNQLNVVAPGAQDQDGDGVIELPEEQVDAGTNVVSLGGNSVAALGNANNRVAGPTLTLLTSLLVGRHTLISFVEALETLNLSDIQAQPAVSVADNQTARIQVGEQTPLRVIDAAAGAAGGAGGAGLPTASVEIQETGIILEATPHVTANNDILLDLRAERSSPQLAESDVGFIFQTQNAQTRVLLKDGETAVIAGLTVTEQNEVRSGVPLLMDLPFIGRLFRVTRESRIQRDLIILVTPNIVRGS